MSRAPSWEGQNPYRAAESLLHNEFAQRLGQISLADIARQDLGHKGSIDEYGLIPVTGHLPTSNTSMAPASFNCEVPIGVTVEYLNGPELRDRPHLDAWFGIGLTYLIHRRPHLFAISSGGIDRIYQDNDAPARLIIRQIQSLVSYDRQPELSKALKGGFSFRDALVAAWERLATDMGVAQIAIWSSEKTPKDPGIDESVRKAYSANYDQVAEKRGYRFDPQIKLWLKDLPVEQTQQL